MSSLRLATQLPRRAPQSLSYGSLGVATRPVSNHASLRVSREPLISSRPHALAHSSFMSSPSTAFCRHPGFTPSPSLSFSLPVTSPVSTDRRFWPFLSPMPSADSPFWPVVVWALCPISATPNKALQRTAPGCHGGCSPQSLPRSRRASPPPSLSLRSLGHCAHQLCKPKPK